MQSLRLVFSWRILDRVNSHYEVRYPVAFDLYFIKLWAAEVIVLWSNVDDLEDEVYMGINHRYQLFMASSCLHEIGVLRLRVF